MTSLADHISENPVFLSLLQMVERYCREFSPAQSASEQDGDHGVVALTPDRAAIKDGEEPFALFARQPVAEAHAMLFRPFYPTDPGSQIRTQQPGVRGFVSQSASRRKSKINRRSSIASLLQVDPVSRHDRLVECEPRF